MALKDLFGKKQKLDMKDQLWIASLFIAVAFLSVSIVNLMQTMQEQRILKDSFISSLASQYDQEIGQCLSSSAFGEEGEEATIPSPNACIEEVNASRTAELLKGWGQEDLLQQPQ